MIGVPGRCHYPAELSSQPGIHHSGGGTLWRSHELGTNRIGD